MLAFKLTSFQIDYLFAYLIALESAFDLEPENLKAAIFSSSSNKLGGRIV